MKKTFSKFTLMLLHTITILGISCSSNDSNTANNSAMSDTSTLAYNDKKFASYFPFETTESGGKFTILAELESEELFPKYTNFFEKYGYTGNGYSWEGHITQILEKLDGELLKHVEFDSEAGAFFAYADTKENQVKFVKLLSPIFADLPKLGEYVKKAKRSRIND